MESLELNRVEEWLFAVGLLLIFVSWGFRIRVFSRFGDDPVISELTFGTFATTFADLLSIKLFRARASLPKESKRTVFSFIALHWGAAVLMLVALSSYVLRSLL